MRTINKQPLLSICIPTWNRSNILALSLKSFTKQIVGIDKNEIELYVSDNCSDDDTEKIVNDFIADGLPITYNRNENNIGAAGNFVKCMQWASGKYILLLGDDDILEPGAVKYLLDKLRGNDYGIVHIHQYENIVEECRVYDNVEDLYKQVSYWFTFMSGTIFRKEVVEMIDYRKYLHTHLLQMPYYLQSATLGKNNLLINKEMMQAGLDCSNNGGYNFYEVFVKNYLNIWKECVEKKMLSVSCYEYLKKDIYMNFILRFNFLLLVRHKNVKDENDMYNRNGFKIEGAKEILKRNYGDYWYYKMSWIYYLKSYRHLIVKKLKRFIMASRE